MKHILESNQENLEEYDSVTRVKSTAIGMHLRDTCSQLHGPGKVSWRSKGCVGDKEIEEAHSWEENLCIFSFHYLIFLFLQELK